MRAPSKLFALLGSLSLPGAVGAQAMDFARRVPEFPPRDYTCRLNGDDIHLGERRCLRTPQGQHMAVCGMALNMSTWQALGSPCD